MAEAENVEPVQPKKRRRRRQLMPNALKERAATAGRQHDKRYPAPTVDVVSSGGSWTFESPFRSADEEDWWRLLGEAFGTRTKAVVEVFIDQVARLVGTSWDAEAKRNLPRQSELQAALAIVAAMKPRNEAEAAQAAQAFALHVVAMRTGRNIVSVPGGPIDPRQALALANLVKAYSGVMDSMRKGRRSGSTRQIIKVQKDVRIYNDCRSVTLGGGGATGDDQPDGPEGITRARARSGEVVEGRTPAIESVPALPGPPEMREPLQRASDEGAQGVPRSRWKVAGSPQG